MKKYIFSLTIFLQLLDWSTNNDKEKRTLNHSCVHLQGDNLSEKFYNIRKMILGCDFFIYNIFFHDHWKCLYPAICNPASIFIFFL